MTPRYVLDSYALLALLNAEPGAALVERLLRRAEAGELELWLSAINLGELTYVVQRRWGAEKMRAVQAHIEALALNLVTADLPRVLAAAHLKAQYPISYADAFAAALALEMQATLVTGDLEFSVLRHKIPIAWLVDDAQVNAAST